MATEKSNKMPEACARIPHGDSHVELCVRAPGEGVAQSLVEKAAAFFTQPPSAPNVAPAVEARKDE